MFLFFSKLLPLFLYPIGLVCLLLLLVMLLRGQARWQRRARAVLVITSFLLIWLSGNRFVAMGAALSLERQHAPLAIDVDAELPVADAIVVLGGMTREQAYPRPTHEVTEQADRLIYAARLWQAGVAPRIIVSGGMVGVRGPAHISEAEMMAELLGVMSVPADAILLEAESQNTYQNTINTRDLMQAEGIDHVLLVTSAMHMPRSAALFAKQGINFTPAPTDFFVTDEDWAFYTTPNLEVQVFNLIPSAEDVWLTSLAIKEWIGFGIYRARGWL